MRDWSFGGNGLRQFKFGSVELIEMPLWLWLVEWWSNHGCSFIPPIPFPNWPKRPFDKDEPQTLYTPKEWYGDLRQLYCSHVCNPLTMWIWKHPKRKTYSFDIGWDKLREVMYEYDKKYFDEFDELQKEMDEEERSNEK